MKKKSKPAKKPDLIRNEIRLKLLFALPDFQEDLEQVRVELGIPSDGFKDDKTFFHWYEKLVGWPYDAPISPQRNSDPLHKRLIQLGKKYKLPEHFYLHQNTGLLPYIARGIFSAPGYNSMIDLTFDSVGSKVITIKTFGPLSKTEGQSILKALAKIQKEHFPKEIAITTRERKQFDRDLEIYKDLSSRTTKPVLREKYDGYLSMIRKTAMTKKKWREMKRIHKHGIYKDYDEKTSSMKGREIGVKSAAVRKAEQRIRILIKQLFGDSFMGH